METSYRCFAMTAKPITIYTCKLQSGQADKLHDVLEKQGFESREVPYAAFAGKKDKLNVVFYTSGKLVIQGKGTQEFVQFVLEPDILGEVKLGYENVLDPSRLDPRIGIDESGKGIISGHCALLASISTRTWSSPGSRRGSWIPSEFPVINGLLLWPM
jgi:ribonuclease HIII